MRIPSFIVALAVAGVALLSSGCALLTKGKTQMVVVRSAPAGATASINGTPVGVTPFKVRLERDQVYRIDVEKEGFAKQAALVLPSTDNYDRRFLKWGLDYDLGAATELVPEEMIVVLKGGFQEYTSADRFDEMTARINQADSLLASGQISAADHKLIVAQITDFYSQP
jgi:hypothetical protein